MSKEEVEELHNAPRIGVLTYQGDFREHIQVLSEAGALSVEVKKPEHLEGLAGLVLPGGESTTIGNLMQHYGMDEAIRARHKQGMALFGTCAGLILMAKEIDNSTQPCLGLMDITAARNAFGRQLQSFEADIPVKEFGTPDIHGVFIRAPYISDCSDEVQQLAMFNDRLVLARQGKLLAAAFHPELTGETRVHKYFIEIATGRI